MREDCPILAQQWNNTEQERDIYRLPYTEKQQIQLKYAKFSPHFRVHMTVYTPDYRGRIFKRLWSPGIDSIQRNEFRQPMRSLAGRYDNPFPTRFLAPLDCLKIPAQSED